MIILDSENSSFSSISSLVSLTHSHITKLKILNRPKVVVMASSKPLMTSSTSASSQHDDGQIDCHYLGKPFTQKSFLDLFKELKYSVKKTKAAVAARPEHASVSYSLLPEL